MKKLSVLILTPHPITSIGLKSFLESDEMLSVCYCADNITNLFNYLTENHPDILFIDDAIGDEYWETDYLNGLPESFAKARKILFTESSNPVFLETLTELGIDGIIHKISSREEIIEAVKRVGAGNIYVDKFISFIIGGYKTTHESSGYS